MRNGQNNIVYISDYTAGQYRRFANIYPDKVVLPKPNYCNVAIAAEMYTFGGLPRHFVSRNDIYGSIVRFTFRREYKNKKRMR